MEVKCEWVRKGDCNYTKVGVMYGAGAAKTGRLLISWGVYFEEEEEGDEVEEDEEELLLTLQKTEGLSVDGLFTR